MVAAEFVGVGYKTAANKGAILFVAHGFPFWLGGLATTSSLHMNLLCIALCVTLLLAGQANAEEPFLRLNVRDAHVLNLAVGVSNALDQNIVVSGYSASRISIDGSFGSAEEFYSSLANRLGGKVLTDSGVWLLHPACLVVGTPAVLPFRQKPISLHFHRIRAVALLEILADFNNLPYGEQSVPERVEILGLRLDGVSSSVAHHAIAIASGAALERKGDAYVAVRVGNASLCGDVAEVDVLPSSTGDDDCPSRLTREPRRDGGSMRCEPLERYPLEEIATRGFVVIFGKRYVLLEASDRRTFFAKEGDYLGQHFGRIVSADDLGFVVKENKQDAAGRHYFEYVHIDYANKRSVLAGQ